MKAFKSEDIAKVARNWKIDADFKYQLYLVNKLHFDKRYSTFL